MLMNSKTREAARVFDHCPNREMAHAGTHVRLRCPKYPTGLVFMPKEMFDKDKHRGEAARFAGCLGCKFSTELYHEIKDKELLERLHEAIAEGCGTLYTTEHYPEAVVQGYKIVRDRLRDLTGFERASEAFGKGGLHIEGSAAEHVDQDFQNAAKYVMMGIDSFRNEGSHTSYGTITGSEQAYEHLVLCSLAMNLLDSATAPTPPDQ